MIWSIIVGGLISLVAGNLTKNAVQWGSWLTYLRLLGSSVGQFSLGLGVLALQVWL